MAAEKVSLLHLTCGCGASLKFSVPGFSPSSIGRERAAFDKAHQICRTTPTTQTPEEASA